MSCFAGKACGGIGCTSGLQLQGEVTAPDGMVGIEVCLNGTCKETTFDPVANPGTCARFDVYDYASSVCFLGKTDPARQPMSGTVVFGDAKLQDGDHYTLTVSDKYSGAVLGIADKKVQYADVYPNGPGCDSEPCRVATLKVAPP